MTMSIYIYIEHLSYIQKDIIDSMYESKVGIDEYARAIKTHAIYMIPFNIVDSIQYC